jgi:WD40 repeat protein
MPIDWARGLDFSPDGRLLAAGTRNGLIEMIDVKSGKVIRKLAGHTQHIGAVRFSPDGNRLASAGNTHDAMKVWDVEAGRELVNFKSEIGWGYSHRQVEWSPDGNSILLMGGDADVTIWRVPSIQVIKKVEGRGG